MTDTQHVLRLTATEEFEFDPEAVLAFARSTPELAPLLYGVRMDEDVIVYTFDALNGSQLGEQLFSSFANDDHGCELLERER